jgi:hypothetical protein
MKIEQCPCGHPAMEPHIHKKGYKRINVVSSVSGDWYGLYINGKLVHEGHSISYKDVFEALNLKYEYEELDFENRLPETYQENFKQVSQYVEGKVKKGGVNHTYSIIERPPPPPPMRRK